jgi:hypothetical protein
MTKFSDELFDDLMREHGTTLANVAPPAPRRHRVTGRQVMLAAGGGGLAVAAAVAGTVVATSGPAATVAGGSASNRAYAVTQNPDGSVTLTAYQKSGIAGINGKLRTLGDKNVYVVPIEPGCPSINSLPKPAVSGVGHRIGAAVSMSHDGSVTVDAHGIPAGDIMVIAMQVSGRARLGVSTLTSGPVPKCVSLPALPPPPANSGSGAGSVSGHSAGNAD